MANRRQDVVGLGRRTRLRVEIAAALLRPFECIEAAVRDLQRGAPIGQCNRRRPAGRAAVEVVLPDLEALARLVERLTRLLGVSRPVPQISADRGKTRRPLLYLVPARNRAVEGVQARLVPPRTQLAQRARELGRAGGQLRLPFGQVSHRRVEPATAAAQRFDRRVRLQQILTVHRLLRQIPGARQFSGIGGHLLVRLAQPVFQAAEPDDRVVGKIGAFRNVGHPCLDIAQRHPGVPGVPTPLQLVPPARGYGHTSREARRPRSRARRSETPPRRTPALVTAPAANCVSTSCSSPSSFATGCFEPRGA